MKTINGWTKQKMIDHIKKEFKGLSFDGKNCLYRSPEGKKCALGVFIPDQLYIEDLEKRDADELCDILQNGSYSYSGLKAHLEKLQAKLPLSLGELQGLQRVHDGFAEAKGNISDQRLLQTLINWIEINVEDA